MSFVEEEQKMRDGLKGLINDVPVEHLSELLLKIKEFLLEKKIKAKTEVVEAERERDELKKLTEEVVEEKLPEGTMVTTLNMALVEDADKMVDALKALQEGTKRYKSAVVVDTTKVRTVEEETDKVGGYVKFFMMEDQSSAEETVYLFDGILKKEIGIVKVTRDETKITVNYALTGIKILKKERSSSTGKAYRVWIKRKRE